MEPLSFLERISRLTGGCAADERFIFCGFPGDPTVVDGRNWRPRAWRPGEELPISPQRTNGYLAVSTFRQATDGTWRRRNDLFRSGRLMMVDDVGTKVDPSAVSRLPPTAIIETSPANFQYCYLFPRPEVDERRMAALIAGFIASRLADGDPGMAGVNRVFRLPGFLNCKRAYWDEGRGWWRTRLVEFEPARLYTPQELAKGFGVSLLLPRRRKSLSRAFLRSSPAVRRATAAHETLERLFAGWGMVRGRALNRADWLDVRCPWEADHSARAQTGASLRRPAEENEWAGAFVCHHGSHKDLRGIADVWRWAAGRCLDELQGEEEDAE